MEGSRWERSGRTWQAVSMGMSSRRVDVGRIKGSLKTVGKSAPIVTKEQPEIGVQAAWGVSEIMMLLVNKIINIIELIVKKMNFYFFYFVTIFLFNSPIFIAI